tara:strand:+ start:19900 stop:20652 length:753 start_codon:yes stop_codon:yes gene_type:complete
VEIYKKVNSLDNFFIKDQWLSKQLLSNTFQFRMESLTAKDLSNKWKKFTNDNQDREIFVYSKIKTNEIEKSIFLESKNFKLIETNIVFELKSGSLIEKFNDKNVEIKFADGKHKNSVASLAKNNFKYSRFHQDPKINNNTADLIKYSWAENFFLEHRGDQMILGFVEGKVVAFLQLIFSDDDIIIDLIAVDKKVRGRKLGCGLIQFAVNNIRHSSVKVGTQISNTSSIRLYQKLGFKFSDSNYVFHFHSK